MGTEVRRMSHEGGDTARPSKASSLESDDTIECSDPEGERTLQQWLRQYDVQVSALDRG
jgi:hypothetical protein